MFNFDIDDEYQQPQVDFSDVLHSFLSSYNQRNRPQQNQNNYYGRMNQGQPQQPSPYENFGSGSSLMDLLRKRESGGNYRAMNNLGYSGAYQFGAPALETIGYLKPGRGRMGNKALDNPENWTIEGGKEAFLSNPQLQDKAMQMLMGSNKKSLEKMGMIKENMDPRIINAMLAAAHLAGPGGVKALMSGRNRKDAYGTPASEYFNLGMRAR